MSEGASKPSLSPSPAPSSVPSPALPEGRTLSLQHVVSILGQKEGELRKNIEFPEDYILPTRLLSIQRQIASIREKYGEIDPERERDKKFLENLGSLIDSVSSEMCDACDALLKEYATSLEAEKVDAKALKEFVYITQGKAKKIYGRLGEDHEVTVSGKTKTEYDRIYIVARNVGKTGELEREKQVRTKIAEAHKKTGIAGENLDLAFEMIEEEAIEEQVPMAVQGAKGDLEHHLMDTPVTFPESLHLASQCLHGLADMHAVGYVHGDLKLDNVLVYRLRDEKGNCIGYQLKLSDFGKTREMGPQERGMYTGNPRFAAPECVLTQKGEVFSAALMMIRVLEQEVLPKNGMMVSLEPKDCKDASSQAEKRQGIERFLVQNKRCLEGETTSFRGLVRVIGLRVAAQVAKVPQQKIDDTSKEVYRYIEALIDALKRKHPERSSECERLGALLKKMTDRDPGKRPTAGEADQEMKKIEESLQISLPPPRPAPAPKEKPAKEVFYREIPLESTSSNPLETE